MKYHHKKIHASLFSKVDEYPWTSKELQNTKKNTTSIFSNWIRKKIGSKVLPCFFHKGNLFVEENGTYKIYPQEGIFCNSFSMTLEKDLVGQSRPS